MLIKVVIMEECIFCKIAKGDIPSNKVYEDKETLAFLDIAPVSKGHTLVIPKEHAEKVYELSKEASEALFKTVKKVSLALTKSCQIIRQIRLGCRSALREKKKTTFSPNL